TAQSSALTHPAGRPVWVKSSSFGLQMQKGLHDFEKSDSAAKGHARLGCAIICPLRKPGMPLDGSLLRGNDNDRRKPVCTRSRKEYHFACGRREARCTRGHNRTGRGRAEV